MTTHHPHRLTCSGIALAEHCAWSFRMDSDRVVDNDRWLVNRAIHTALEMTIWSGETHCHLDAEMASKLTEGEIARVQTTHGSWLADWWDDQAAGGWQAEKAFAFDPFTGARMDLQPKEHRDYSGAPVGWVPGTADVFRAGPDDLVDLVDWKSGLVPPDAEDNAQLAGLGLGAGALHLRGGIGHVTEDGVRLEWAEFDLLDLHEWRERIAAVVAGIPTAEPIPGPHCRNHFCASYGLCPATASALEHVAPEVKRRLPVVMAASAIESTEHASSMYRTLREAKAAFDVLYNRGFDALRMWADQNGGVPVGDGKVWIRREGKRETIDLSDLRAVEALRSVLGDTFELGVSFETSKAAIKRAARAIKVRTKEPIGITEAKAIDALRAAGAIRTSPSTTYDETKIREEDAEPSEAA